MSEVLYQHYRARWREIESEWLGAADSLEVLSAALTCVRAARDELRAQVLRLSKNFPGPYLVPV